MTAFVQVVLCVRDIIRASGNHPDVQRKGNGGTGTVDNGKVFTNMN